MRAVPVAAVIFVCAYLLGSIPFGLLVSSARGVDIRAHGSRNIGATNVWRVLGRTWGLITFFCDVAKGWLAVVGGFWIAARFPGTFRDPAFAGITAALGCIVGHNFPIWLKFRGGKGVATSLGVIIGMMPLASIVIFSIWLIVLKISRYVSLASIVAAVALPVVVIVFLFADWLHGWGNFYFACAAALLVIRRHRENIKRLMVGTENRFGKTDPKEDTPIPPPSSEERTG
jgi:glycerol-3-phosphate acyltransferase PlsY